MEPVPASPSLEQQNYWQEFVRLKADICYLRSYRDNIRGWTTTIAALRAITSSASIGAWVIFRQYAFIWATLIAAAQVADALKGVFPLYRRKKALSRWLHALNLLFIDAQRNWDDISAGLCNDAEIRTLVHKLRTKKNAAESKFIPDGLKRNQRFFLDAEREAIRFFQARYALIVARGEPNEADDSRNTERP